MFDLKYNADGLIPAIVQDHFTGKVLMLAYMNEHFTGDCTISRMAEELCYEKSYLSKFFSKINKRRTLIPSLHQFLQKTKPPFPLLNGLFLLFRHSFTPRLSQLFMTFYHIYLHSHPSCFTS